MKLLIVDDSNMSRKALIVALPAAIRESCDLLEAANGEEAVDLYKEQHPDIVFLDLTMPVMNGYEALRLIMEYDPKAKVIVVSSDAQAGAVKLAGELGAKNHISKPISAALLQPVLEKVL